MGLVAPQITSLVIVYSTVYSEADQRKYQSSASLAFVRGIHRGPVNSPHKWPVTRKVFPFDDVIMNCIIHAFSSICYYKHIYKENAQAELCYYGVLYENTQDALNTFPSIQMYLK